MQVSATTTKNECVNGGLNRAVGYVHSLADNVSSGVKWSEVLGRSARKAATAATVTLQHSTLLSSPLICPIASTWSGVLGHGLRALRHRVLRQLTGSSRRTAV
ncbi:hypothetical protein ECG_03459 [Echinococcus granulosus]|nr:hypothetical protein ECG_03459 [Echinococcus granulosus]